MPIYDVTGISRANHDNGQGPYPILGFAAFHVTGYSFNGNANAGTLGRDCPMRPALGETQQNQVPKYCIRGDFIRMLAPGDDHARSQPGLRRDQGLTSPHSSHNEKARKDPTHHESSSSP